MIGRSATAALAALAVIAAGANTTALASAAPAAPAPTYTFSSELESLMLSPQRVAAVTGADAMAVMHSSTDLADARGSARPARCVGVFEPGQRVAYDGTPWLSVSTQLLADARPGRARHVVNQTVVSFVDAGTRADFLNAQAENWARCAGETITFTQPSGDVVRWDLGEPELRRDNTVLAVSQASATGTCERAMAGYADIVVDVMACDFRGESYGQAETVAAAIGATAAQVTT